MKKPYYQFFRYLLIFVTLFFLFDLTSQELKWEAIKNASGYRVQIRNEFKKIILDKKVTTNSYELGTSIEPGTYEHRIGVLNKYGVAKTWTDWISFEAVASLAPKLTNEETVYLLKEEGTKKIVLEGENFSKDTKIRTHSSKGSGSIPIKDTKIITKNKMEITLDAEGASKGEYDLVIENPNNKTYEKKRFFIVKEKDAYQRCSIYEPLWRSAAMPGWGQHHRSNKCDTKEKWKLKVYPVITLVLLAAYYQTNQEYNQNLAEYNERIATTFLIRPGHPLQLANYIDAEQKYTKTEQSITRLNQVSTLLLGFYLWNIADVFLFHPYKPIKIKEESVFFYSNIYYTQNPYSKSEARDLQYILGFSLKY